MIYNRRQLARQALFNALQLRTDSGYQLIDPICIYDFVEKHEKHKVEVQFLDVSSMEGMYCRSPGPVIIISSERPTGRQVFNCAHEFGHHVFNHGSRVDELIENRRKDDYTSEEFLADCFAGFLLMPKVAVLRAFKSRGWKPERSTPVQLYMIASYFGVGYSALITHMHQSLKILHPARAKELSKAQPKDIKAKILGEPTSSNLVIADENWTSRPIDIQVGDLIITRPETRSESGCVRLIGSSEKGMIFEGITSGRDRFSNEQYNWTSYVRVSRKEYVGFSQYRHLPEVEDDE